MKKINIADLLIFQMIFILTVFRDYSNISIISQTITFAFIFLEYIKKNNLKMSFEDSSYVIYKLIFIFWCFISSFWAVNQKEVYSVCITLILRMLTGMAIILYVKDLEKLKKLLKYIIISSLFLCLRLVIVVPISAWGSSRIGIFLNHDPNNGYGNTGITYILGFAITCLLTSKEIIKNKKIRYLLCLIFIIFSFLSGSKKQIFFLLATILIISIYNSKDILKLLKNFGIAMLIICISGFVIFNNTYLYNILGSRLLSFTALFSEDTTSDVDVSTEARTLFLKDAFLTFESHPVKGIGINCFKYVNSYSNKWAENNFIELLADVGIIGFLLYYSLYIKIIKELLCRKRNKFDLMLCAQLVNFIIIDLTMVSYFNNTLQLNFAILYAANKVIKIKYKETEKLK